MLLVLWHLTFHRIKVQVYIFKVCRKGAICKFQEIVVINDTSLIKNLLTIPISLFVVYLYTVRPNSTNVLNNMGCVNLTQHF